MIKYILGVAATAYLITITPFTMAQAPSVNVEARVIVEEPATPTQLIIAAFPNAPVMLKFAKAESKVCTDNVNPKSSARGCFQILKKTWADYVCIGDPMNTIDNINCAKKIYDKSGTAPWNESKSVWSKL